MTNSARKLMVTVVGALALTLSAGATPARAAITGDCTNSGTVAINNVQACVNIYLGSPLISCPNCDQNADGSVAINEVQGAVNCYLDSTNTNCPKVTPVGTPVISTPTITSTLTPTVATITATRTITATNSPTPTTVIVVTNTPTRTPTNTAVNTATGTPTNTPTNTAPVPTATNTGGAAACGNGVVESGEQCDNGGTCVSHCSVSTQILCTKDAECPAGETCGATAGMKCPSNVAGGVNCAAGATCKPFGGDGCANNCTNETTIHYVFSGASCYGGTKNGQDCHFKRTCVGGQYPGRACQTSSDCGSSVLGNCVSECSANNGVDGSDCFAVGACTAGDAGKIGTTCPAAQSPSVPPPSVLVCQAGTKPGISCAGLKSCSNDPLTECTVNGDCGGGTCINPCGTGGTCVNPCGSAGVCVPKSGATLQALGLVVVTLGVGPIVGGQDLVVGGPSSDGRIPVVVPVASVHFDPIQVPALACACVRGVESAAIHGPGNSASGFIGCGAAGLSGVNVDISVDHVTNPGHPKNGPGSCTGGSRAGLACAKTTDCSGGGTCSGQFTGGGVCAGGTNKFKVCKQDTDCPNSICNSPDDLNCTNTDAPPPDGSGGSACREAKQVCTSGSKIGQACTKDADCAFAVLGACGVPCNARSIHSSAFLRVCNSPHHLTFSGSGPMGSALIVQTSSIGTIATPDDDGTCALSAECTGFTVNDETRFPCQVNAECATGTTCAKAICAGVCNIGGAPCQADLDCTGGGGCNAGARFASACTGPNTCGVSNICVPVVASKGFDGLPCTADDAVSAKGQVQTYPSTTGIASSNVIDADNGALGNLIMGNTCTGKTTCLTAVHGSLFNCSVPLSQQTVSGASTAVAFPNLDQDTILDDVVTTIFTAK